MVSLIDREPDKQKKQVEDISRFAEEASRFDNSPLSTSELWGQLRATRNRLAMLTISGKVLVHERSLIFGGVSSDICCLCTRAL